MLKKKKRNTKPPALAKTASSAKLEVAQHTGLALTL